MPKEYGTPGPRAVYPDICTSRSIAACSIEAQLLFDRLISQADDQGRIEGDIAIIKSVCVPLIERITTRNLARFLGELEAEDLIFRYQHGRSSLTQLPTWWRWQQGMRRAYPSRWPAPEGWTDAVYGLGADHQASYKTWLNAAERGTAPHNAAFRGDSRHNAALTHTRVGAPAADTPAAPAAPAGALSGADSLPDSPDPAERGHVNPRANGTNPRALGTNPRAVATKDQRGRAWRRSQRQLAYHRGAITEGQLAEMNQRDAPPEELPDWAEHQERLAAEADAVARPEWAGPKPEPVEAAR